MKKVWIFLALILFIFVLLMGLYVNHLDVKTDEFITKASTIFINFKNTYEVKKKLKELDKEFKFENKYIDYIQEIFLIRTAYVDENYRKEYVLAAKAGAFYPVLYYPVFKYFDSLENGIFKLKKSMKTGNLLKKNEDLYISLYRGYILCSVSDENLKNYIKDIKNKKLNKELGQVYNDSEKNGIVNGYADLDKILKKDEKILKNLVLYENNEKKIKAINRYFEKIGVLSFEYYYLADTKDLVLDLRIKPEGKIMKLLNSGEKTLKSNISKNSLYFSSKSFKEIADIIFNDFKEQGLQYDFLYNIFSGEDPRDTAENIGDELIFNIGENLETFSIMTNLKNKEKMIKTLERLRPIAKFRKTEKEYVLSKGLNLQLEDKYFYINKEDREYIKDEIEEDELFYSRLGMELIDKKYRGIDLVIRAKKSEDKFEIKISSKLEELKKILNTY